MNTRIRKSPPERRREILEAAIRLISRHGYNGISLQDVAQEVGMTRQGILHYVGTKDGLATMVMSEFYDHTTMPSHFLASGLPGSAPDAPHFPAYLRYVVRQNVKRKDLVQVFTMMQAESLDPKHPAHEYFEHRPALIWETLSRYPWKVPPQVGTWEDCEPLQRMAMEAMDGIQLRWLRATPIDLYDEWLAFERVLFPSPLWDNCR